MSKHMLLENPCLHCGACCAHYRVSFYWGEAGPLQSNAVPPELTEEVTDFRRCMKGTNQKQPMHINLRILTVCAPVPPLPKPLSHEGRGA
ncbi:MAG: YkgJ family cysteine cluster protein, partial [Anaerolineae bacterium]|nr:YkgJ family cysteine cluster protein [Anaerolineae bacterium]